MALRPYGEGTDVTFAPDLEMLLGHVAIARLVDKRQVIWQPSWYAGAEFRLSHTLSVVGVANTLAERLKLRDDLTWAIALAHDVAHCPFGHLGEIVLNGNLPKALPRYDHVDAAPYLLQNVFERLYTQWCWRA